MRRRYFLTFFGGALAWPLMARAQQSGMPVIGFLNGTTPGAWAARVAAFHRGLAEVGFVEGQNVAIEYRWAENDADRLPELANDLVARGVAVIAATGGTHVARVAKRATASIPIVFTAGTDPVTAGLVATLNRPGGNATGISLLSVELAAKRMEILHDLVPAARTVAILINPKSVIVDAETKSLLAAAQGFGIHLSVVEATNERELDLVFAGLSQHPAQALFVTSSPLFESRRDQLAALTARNALPALFETRDYAEAGGLASYGPDYALAYREAGVYVGRILRGAKPADLPVVQLSKIELVLNARAAAALGLAIPPAILTRADEVIE